jgi:uncharacterized membrane protein
VRPGSRDGDQPSASAGEVRPREAQRIFGLPVTTALIIAAAIIALDAWMPLALSALLVGVLVALIGYFMLQKGLSALKQVDLKPRETIESLKEDKEWAQQQTK